MILKLKQDRHIRKMDLAEKKELYDHFYAIVKEHFLLDHILKEEKYDIDNAATQQILERGRQEWEKPLQWTRHKIQ